MTVSILSISVIFNQSVLNHGKIVIVTFLTKEKLLYMLIAKEFTHVEGKISVLNY